MKLPHRSTVVKLLAAAAVNSVVYSVFIAVRAALFRDDGGFCAVALFAFTVALGSAAGVVLLGRRLSAAEKASKGKTVKFISFMLNIRDSAVSMSTLVAWLIIAVPTVLTFFVYRGFGTFRCLLEVFYSVIVYIIVLKQSGHTASRIMNKAAVYISLTLIALCLELPYFISNLMYLRPWFFAALYLFILAFLVVRNQEDIDQNIFAKKHIEKSILPKNLRRFNLMSVLVVYAVILLAFNFKGIIIGMLDLMGELAKAIIRAIIWILNHLNSASDITEDGSVQDNMPDMLPYAEEAAASPLLNLIGNIIKYFILLYAAYRLMFFLVRRMPPLYRKIAGWLKKLFSIGSTEDAACGCMDYYDETEVVRLVKQKNVKTLGGKASGNRRSLKGINDPVERVRFMYSGILGAISKMGVDKSASDTTKDIICKTTAASADTANHLSCFTDIYDEVRYGGLVPDKELLEKSQEYYLSTIKSTKERK